MEHDEIRLFLDSWKDKRERTIVIVDFGNVEKWKHSLGWKVGIRELATLVKAFSYGKRPLRRFYYGADFGPNEKSEVLSQWSSHILKSADMNGFEVIQKRVKYIHSATNAYGMEKKCDLDVDMAIDLIEEIENYDHVVLFSGDGDLVRALSYLHMSHGKETVVMSARGHIGREVIDGLRIGTISNILYADDFDYRLDFERHKRPRGKGR